MISPQANNEAYHRLELEAAYLALADDRCGSIATVLAEQNFR
jgi:hypothetical protein